MDCSGKYFVPWIANFITYRILDHTTLDQMDLPRLYSFLFTVLNPSIIAIGDNSTSILHDHFARK